MLEYDMDISADSWSHIFTPDLTARSFQFYVTEMGCYEAGSRYFTRRDGKPVALMIFTLSGCGEMEWNAQRCRLEEGSAVVIYCDAYHEYRTVSQEPWRFLWLHFDGDGLNGYRPLLMEHLTPVTLCDQAEMRQRFRAIESADFNEGVLALAEMSHAISGILLTMLRSLASPDSGNPALCRDEVRRVAEYINANLEKPIGMEDFIAVANLSKYHLIHIFRQQMGMPPYRYLHHCRVNRAQALLRTTDLPVSEISARVGYADPVNFIRHFKMIAGCTPAGYRRDSIQLP